MLSLLVAVGAILALTLVVLTRADAVIAQISKLLSHFRPLYKWGQRRYTRASLEARARKLLKGLQEDAPFLTEKMEVSWVDPATTREAFLQEGKVVVHLRFDDRYDHNLVHATCLFVSTSLLFRAKRYLGQEQRESLDLYVTAKLLERADDGLVDVFLSNYLLPRTDEMQSRVSDYFSAYETLARAGLFYEVLLRELDFLGSKVFGRRFIPELPPEVDALIDMLETLALREWRERVELTLLREYCRTAVVLVGMQEKLTAGIEPWIEFIERHLIPRDTESIYLLGMWQHRESLKQIAEQFSDRYQLIASRHSTPMFADGVKRDAFAVVLQRNDPSVFQPRTPERRRRLASEPPDISSEVSKSTSFLGTVRSFGDQGYGFLELDNLQGDVFFHVNDCIAPPPFIARGDRVECDVLFEGIEENPKAYNVRFLRLVPTDQPRETMAARARDNNNEEKDGRNGEKASAPVAQLDFAPAKDAESEKRRAPSSKLPPSGRVQAEILSFGNKQFGFLRIPDGRRVFFHLNDCIDPPSFIKPGSKVTCEVFFNAPEQLKAREVEFPDLESGSNGQGSTPDS